MTDQAKKKWNALSIIGGLFVFAFIKASGMALVIPMIFALLALFGANLISKRLEISGNKIGGFGPGDSSTGAFNAVFSIESGHLLWAMLGLGLGLTNAIKDIGITHEVSAYVEFAIFFSLFLALCARPRWWTAALLIAYHCVALVLAPMVMDELRGVPMEMRTQLEKGIISHMVFHALAIFAIGWYGMLRIKMGDEYFAFWKSLNTGTQNNTVPAQPLAQRLSHLAELHKNGLISDADLEMKKREILKDL